MMATIIPVALIGVQEIIGPDGLFPKKRGTVTVRFGKPITMSRSTSIAQATAEIEAAMQETIDSNH
jgi:1-acyl-sn-glycerol-3-phosphate acyltransferase